MKNNRIKQTFAIFLILALVVTSCWYSGSYSVAGSADEAADTAEDLTNDLSGAEDDEDSGTQKTVSNLEDSVDLQDDADVSFDILSQDSSQTDSFVSVEQETGSNKEDVQEEDTVDAEADTEINEEELIAMDLTDASFTITPGINPVGYPGITYSLLENISVSPGTDGEGNPVKIRVKSVASTDSTWVWPEEDQNNSSLTPEKENTNFTIIYEAYITDSEGTETVVASKELLFRVIGGSDIGGTLDGDYAYISEAGLVDDSATSSQKAVRTGSAPLDDESEIGIAGNDTTALDNIVRSFDIVQYTAYFKSKVREDALYTAYKNGRLYFEFVLPGTSDQVQFETGSMGWLTAKKDIQYTVTEETYNGSVCQVLKGSYLWEPAEGNPTAIGESYQELSVVIRVLAMHNGETVKPAFTFWLEGNEVPAEGLVTGSNYSCTAHKDMEYKTAEAPEVTVTAAPRYNIEISKGYETFSYVDNFDFSTGNELAQNKDAGTVEGRCHAYGITVQIKGKSAELGLRGCEISDVNTPVTFDVVLSSEYRADDKDESGNNVFDVSDTYLPLVWSLDGNGFSGSHTDGRWIDAYLKYAVCAAPGNKQGSKETCCYDGGSWSCIQEGNVVHVTIKNYDVKMSLDSLPHARLGDGTDTYYYYDKNIENYWEIQNACISGGELWVVQPFTDKNGKYVVNEYGTGTFNTTVKDENLSMKSVSGQTLEKVNDNSNQTDTTDDQGTASMKLESEGSLSYMIAYGEKGEAGYDSHPLTQGCGANGQDWVMPGGGMSVVFGVWHSEAEGMNQGVAYDELVKFDDAFFEPDGTYQWGNAGYYNTENVKFLWAAKPDRSGWNHQNLKPDQAGYDTEMMQATADDLIFFSSLDDLKNAGYTCVGMLMEMRGTKSTARTGGIVSINGTCKSTAEPGYVYMTTISGKAWNKRDVQSQAAAYCKKDAGSLTDLDYDDYAIHAMPGRAGAGTAMNYSSYPESFNTYAYSTEAGLRNYQKSVYDANGFKTGTAGVSYGDSCLVVSYKTNVEITAAQTTTSGSVKDSYDMDTGQRVADFKLTPTARRSAGSDVTEGQAVTTDMYVEVTLPAGLSYISGSSYSGGTYNQAGEGKQGTINGGIKLEEPEVTENSDGTTTLKWTLRDVIIAGAEVTDFEPIYYSCEIGTPGNEDTDVKNNQSLTSTVIIWSDDEIPEGFSPALGNKASDSIMISKNKAVSLSKTADEKVVDAGDGMPFTMNIGNNGTSPFSIVGLESLPYKGDSAGSNFEGVCKVTELTIQNLKEEFVSNLKLYYTANEEERGKSSADYNDFDFENSEKWVRLSVDTDTGKVTLPDDFIPVAIAVAGDLPAAKTLKMHITLLLPDGKSGDYVANRLTQGSMESYGRSYIVSRILEGLVWEDENIDGLRTSGEDLKDGVTVTLMKLKENGDASNPEDYEEYKMADGKTASVTTGNQIDLSGGKTSSYSTGRYKFVNLPPGTFGVLFTSGPTSLASYLVSPKDQGTDDTIDSDATPYYNTKELEKAFISNILMPAKKQITAMVYTSRYHDLGIYIPDYHALPATGGMGTYPFTIGGTALVTAAVLLLARSKRKGAGKKRRR